ncbi:NPP1 family protein [Streptomyces sp. NPDC005408]|uniref:NPP1 family protein n=1 Tax=Streptomyces sp. NPDC005408 TaxID=3155341 RepID=UPI0033AD0824
MQGINFLPWQGRYSIRSCQADWLPPGVKASCLRRLAGLDAPPSRPRPARCPLRADGPNGRGPTAPKAPSAALKPWPDADSGCAATGSYFPTYASVKTCFGTEVRVSYTLFFPKDGFTGGIGHAYDFEHVVTGWKYAGDNKWTRYQIMLSAHGKHRVERDWTQVESVNFNGDWGYGRERPSAYVGWGKHAMFNNQGGLKDYLSQTTDNEYRHADHAGDNTSYVIVTDDSPMAAKFNEYNWGSATDNPARVSRDLCSY